MMYLLCKYDVFRFAQNDVAPLRAAMMKCLPLCAAGTHHLPKACIICRRHTSFAEGIHHLPKYAPSRCAWRAERGTIRFRTATGSDETDFVQKPSADEREPYIHTASEETAVVNKASKWKKTVGFQPWLCLRNTHKEKGEAQKHLTLIMLYLRLCRNTSVRDYASSAKYLIVLTIWLV